MKISTCRAEFASPGEVVFVLFRVPLSLYSRRISRGFPAFGPSAAQRFRRTASVRDILFGPPACQRLMGENAWRTSQANRPCRSHPQSCRQVLPRLARVVVLG